MSGALTVAFSAGALAAFNPCGFALLPGWAAVLVSGEGHGDDLFARLMRALRAGVVATVAFLLVFGLAGLAFSLGFAALGRYLAFVGLAIGLVLAWLGALLLVDGHAPGLNLARRAGRGTGARAVFGFGTAYALGSLSCVLPVFVLTLGIAAGEPFWTRVGGFVGFALGMGTVLALIAIGAALTGEGALKVRALVRVIPRLAGAVVVGAAVVVLARELGLAALSLGHHEPTLAFRSAIAAAATTLAALAALASTRGRARVVVQLIRQRGRHAGPGSARSEENALSQDCCARAGATTANAVPATRAHNSGPLVEVLYFDGCPNHGPAVALVERVAAELRLRPQIRVVNVPDAEAAGRLRFLGSPTVRVGGHDVEPGADERTDFALSCRVFPTDSGFNGEPDELWIRDALLREAAGGGARRESAGASSPVAAALAAARIAPERRGQERSSRLTAAERALYFWILRRFARDGRPGATETRAEALRLGLEPAEAFAKLAREDLVHLNASGEIAVAYPFSGRPTPHRVLIDGRGRVWAMCAIDALGIAPMLELPIAIDSSDPVTGAEVRVKLRPDRSGSWQPEETVVVVGSVGEGPSFGGCCQVLNFFASAASAEQYLREHADVRGQLVSLPEAIEIGAAVFGGVFDAS